MHTEDSRLETVHRVILPTAPTSDVMPLYVDVDSWSIAQSSGGPFRVTGRDSTNQVTGRRSFMVPSGESASFASYFNAFPAGYWRRWTSVRTVSLDLVTRGEGEISVVRSNARGVIQVVEVRRVTGESRVEIDLSLDYFLDGGWYWFDLAAGARGDFSLVRADWRVLGGGRAGEIAVAITTMNREDYCLDILERLASDPDVLSSIITIYVMDQGSNRLRDAKGFARVSDLLGSRLVLIEQDNLGGSGGFARGMFEATRPGSVATHVLLLDDDLQVEPEGVLRALKFSQHTTSPMIVGGHMFDMYDKSTLHAFAEGVDMGLFDWGPIGPSRHDFRDSNLRQSGWIHKRIDSDYNGWWMSLIPVEIIDTIGLALPVFIKWDDAEYSLRASRAGFVTVSLPGAAVWHVSWVDKDDSHDWQAFYHARNRLVAAMLHSTVASGGRLPRRNLALDVRYLLSADYYTVALRQDAYRSVLAGPGPLHDELRTRLATIRAAASGYPEAATTEGVAPTSGFSDRRVAPSSEPGRRRLMALATKLLFRHAFSPPATSGPLPHLAYEDARWWVAGRYDRVLITNAQGSGVSLHQRSRSRFWRMSLQSIRLTLRYRRRWAALAEMYRAELADITSRKAWELTFFPDGE